MLILAAKAKITAGNSEFAGVTFGIVIGINY